MNDKFQQSHRPPMQNGRPFDFQTPPFAIEPLLPFLKPEWTIWECACGQGNLVKALTNNDFNVIGTDILTGHDFLMYEPEKYECIITNPPFDLKGEFLERAYMLEKPFAFLLPLTIFDSAKRQEMFRQKGVEIIFLNRRINFTTPSGKGTGAWFMTFWITNGLNLPEKLNFVKIPKHTHQTTNKA